MMLILQFVLILLLYSVTRAYYYEGKNEDICDVGIYQSPVDIKQHNTVFRKLPDLCLENYGTNFPRGSFVLRNSGSTVIFTISKNIRNRNIHFDLPFIYGGPLDDIYDLEEYHFHWEAEHTFDNGHIRAPLELHIVHKNRQYRNMTEALNHHDGVAVVVFFYQIKRHSAETLSLITDRLKYLIDYNSTTSLGKDFKLSSLIHGVELDKYFTYSGSLTSSPCSEAVTWIIFPKELSVTSGQLNQFRRLRKSDGAPIIENSRETRALNGRDIFIVDNTNYHRRYLHEHRLYDHDEDDYHGDYKISTKFY